MDLGALDEGLAMDLGAKSNDFPIGGAQ